MKKSKKISLAGISASLSTIFLVLGNYIALFDYSFYLLASLCLIISFNSGEIKYGIFAFIVSTGIGMLIAPNVMVMFAYFVFFGPFLLLCEILSMKRIIKWLQYVIKNVFYIISIVLMYFFSQIFIEINMWNLPIYILLIGAIIIMNLYDFLMVRIINQLNRIIQRIINKT